jgi:hypothetical protein
MDGFIVPCILCQGPTAPLIPFDEIINTTRATFAAIESLKQEISGLNYDRTQGTLRRTRSAQRTTLMASETKWSRSVFHFLPA